MVLELNPTPTLPAIDAASDDRVTRLNAGFRRMLSEVHSRRDVVAILKKKYVELGEQGREAEQDAVAEMLDSLTGWASPSARL